MDLTAETRFRSRASSCEICGGQSGIGTGFSPCNAFYHSHLPTCATYSSLCCFCHKDKWPTSVNFQMKQRSSGNRRLWKEECIVDCIDDSGDSNNGFLIASASTSLLMRSSVLHVRSGRASDSHCALSLIRNKDGLPMLMRDVETGPYCVPIKVHCLTAL